MPSPESIVGKLTRYAEREHRKLLRTYPDLKGESEAPLPFRILGAVVSAPARIIKKMITFLDQAERWQEGLDEEVKEKRRQSTSEGLAFVFLILFVFVALVTVSLGG